MAVLVQQQHARLEGHGDGLLGRAPVVRVEDCLAADAGARGADTECVRTQFPQGRRGEGGGQVVRYLPAVGGGCEVEEQGPSRPSWELGG